MPQQNMEGIAYVSLIYKGNGLKRFKVDLFATESAKNTRSLSQFHGKPS